MVRCSQCGLEMDRQLRVASISGSIMGDEQTESFFLCPRCDVYTVEVWFEAFLGEDTVSTRGPVSRAKGDPRVALIRQCPEPWQKKCRCPAHQTYFEGWLD